MLQVLEYRGFIEQAPNGAGYVPTAKLFTLGMEQAPVRTLLEVALPVMRRLSQEVQQSCHLAVRAGADITVIARMESEDLIGFAVHVGHRRAIPLSASGAVLYAFQSESVRAHWEKSFDSAITPAQLARFHKHVAKVVTNGYDMTPSDVVKAITDVSAPIMRGTSAAAALTIPWFEKQSLTVKIQEACTRLRAAAAEISTALTGAADTRAPPSQTTYR
jgi:DNA-binding IclR family transcriptional regulator